MKTCSGCRRTVVFAWAVDGTDARYCTGCINRALREATQELDRQEVRNVLERWRRMGLG